VKAERKLSNKNNGINFVKKCYRTIPIHNPLHNFELNSQNIEVRKDPLTGRESRINIERATRPKQVDNNLIDIRRFLQESTKDCPFCQDNIEVSTPKFQEDLINSGRIRLGQFTLFPNLYPFNKYHAVGILTEDHFTDITAIKSENYQDCFRICNDFFFKVNAKDPDYIYPLISLNFLQPSGASFVHPHVQILIDSKPFEETGLLVDKCLRYYKKKSSNYWEDLIKSEQELGLRYIGDSGCVKWIASFAPRSNNEVIGIIKSKTSCLTELNNNEIADLGEGLSKIFVGLSSLGLQSFNMNAYSGPLKREITEYFLINLRIISRPNLRNMYTSDKGFMEILQEEPIISSVPEETSKKLKAFFD